MESIGIKDTSEALVGVAALIKEGLEAGKDGFQVTDFTHLVKILPELQAAADGGGNIPKELADLSSEEAGQLVAVVVAKLSVEDAKARALIDAGFTILHGAYKMVLAWKM